MPEGEDAQVRQGLGVVTREQLPRALGSGGVAGSFLGSGETTQAVTRAMIGGALPRLSRAGRVAGGEEGIAEGQPGGAVVADGRAVAGEAGAVGGDGRRPLMLEGAHLGRVAERAGIGGRDGVGGGVVAEGEVVTLDGTVARGGGEVLLDGGLDGADGERQPGQDDDTGDNTERPPQQVGRERGARGRVGMVAGGYGSHGDMESSPPAPSPRGERGSRVAPGEW